MGHQNILTLVDYFETMNNCMPFDSAQEYLLKYIADSDCQCILSPTSPSEASSSTGYAEKAATMNSTRRN